MAPRLYVRCILRRRLDEQPDEKEAEKEARNTSSLLCIRLIFRAFPTDIEMQVSSVIPNRTRYTMFRKFRDEPPKFDVELSRKAPGFSGR